MVYHWFDDVITDDHCVSLSLDLKRLRDESGGCPGCPVVPVGGIKKWTNFLV
jgi:hypothetical protein